MKSVFGGLLIFKQRRSVVGLGLVLVIKYIKNVRKYDRKFLYKVSQKKIY